MARYIDADAIPWISLFPDTKKYVLMDTVNKMPAADVVEVVRCKDCKHWSDNVHPIANTAMCFMWSRFGPMNTHAEWHCSLAGRKTE